MQTIPKPNTQALSWFVGEFKNRTLRLNPKYQRNPIWSLGQKCFLIDSLISGCPIPQVFINIVTEGSGIGRKTFYEVVDGQQRLRAILGYINDEYELVSITARSYPVSNIYRDNIGKKYSDLPSSFQDLIWNYQLAVQELREWDEAQIRALFRRLNYVVERLTKQEMRHSQYFGEFVNAVELLAKESFFDELPLFTRRDSQRMKDIEFISELFILLIDGPQDKQESIDDFYANYDVSFSKKKKYIRNFRNVLYSISTIKDFLSDSRFLKKADFYGLVGAVIKVSKNGDQIIDLTPAQGALRDLDKILDEGTFDSDSPYGRYYSTVIEGPNKLPKRKQRIEILLELISANDTHIPE